MLAIAAASGIIVRYCSITSFYLLKKSSYAFVCSMAMPAIKLENVPFEHSLKEAGTASVANRNKMEVKLPRRAQNSANLFSFSRF